MLGNLLNSPNAQFKALSARGSGDRTSSDLKEIELYIKERDDENLTRALDRRCRSLEGMGMSKVDKVSLEEPVKSHRRTGQRTDRMGVSNHQGQHGPGSG